MQCINICSICAPPNRSKILCRVIELHSTIYVGYYSQSWPSFPPLPLPQNFDISCYSDWDDTLLIVYNLTIVIGTTYPTLIFKIPLNMSGLVAISLPQYKMISCCSTACMTLYGCMVEYIIAWMAAGVIGLSNTVSFWSTTPTVSYYKQ